MNKWRILPKLSWTGVIKNGTVYFPYIGAGIFSVFIYFIFSSILYNDIIKTLPNSGYAWMLLSIGRSILAIILIPFLVYTNSFLTKRRKKEIGLYSVLGLEKKHIAFMMLLESALVFAIVIAGGILTGAIFSKLMFLLLLKMTGLPVNVEFVFYPEAVIQTVKGFLVIYGFNFVMNIFEIGKAKPIELLSGSKKGEKEPKLLWIYAVLGCIILGWGYSIAIRSKIDDMIFLNFFGAVILVVIGTYLLFTSGSVAFLKLLKRKKKVYYKPSNFITISGMLYRMKKNAASLVNICIFSTMVIITLICTSSLYLGLEGISDFDYPYDVEVHIRGEQNDEKQIRDHAQGLAKQYGITLKRMDSYQKYALNCGKVEGTNQFVTPYGRDRFRENYKINVITLDDYNKIENDHKELAEGEIYFYSSGEDFKADSINFMGRDLPIKEELEKLYPSPKGSQNIFFLDYFMVAKDDNARNEMIKLWASANGVEDEQEFLDSISSITGLKLEGDKASQERFIKAFGNYCSKQQGFDAFHNNLEGRAANAAMNGGLLFIGILFSMIFFMCLVLIMYYKQISEGYEDKEGFAIMQQVGMSQKEIKGTVHRQILFVFFLPLFGAVLHTAAGFPMVEQLMITLRLFNKPLMLTCTIAATVIFGVFYGISYIMTAKTYYKIIRR